MTPCPISLTVITKNESERLPYTLESVQGLVDEIIVVDSGSTDETVKVAERYGAKVFFRDWTGYGDQKIYAESLVKNKWILNLDADESLTEGLRKEIHELFRAGEPEKAGYEILRYLIFIGRDKPSSLVWEGNFLRLYNKKKAGFSKSRVHDSVLLKDKGNSVGLLTQRITHRCFKSYHHWIEKMNGYTDEQAQDWIERGRPEPSCVRLILEPIGSFFKSLFVKRYITLGTEGVVASYLYATAKLLRLVKVREAYQKKRAE